MKKIKTDIIPHKPTFVGAPKTYDYEAICLFSALGFFLDNDTYFVEQKALRPATEYELADNAIISEKPYFKWYYQPIERPFEQVVQEFATLFEQLLKEHTQGKKVILPLSGGLDSRTQACGLHHIGANVHSYSYSFLGGHDETRYSEAIAKTCGFPFERLTIPDGYLWDEIEKLATINGCYSEFTHPRQMAFSGRYAAMGEVFSLGHWGDVLFDDMGVAANMPLDEQVAYLLKKVVKKGGMELATALWTEWGLEGQFAEYLQTRLKDLLQKINIPENANAQIRAFKSLYWAPRWTSTNLSIFEKERPITLPYYDNRMCAFICTVPERYLSGRQIQIAYLKMRNPALAQITWQAQKPFNLYTYQWNKMPYNLPYRIKDKVKRMINPKLLVQRNWELQFLGKENDARLQQWLFDHSEFDLFIPKKVSLEFYNQFKTADPVYFSHPVSMLLTLSLFIKIQNNAQTT